jgi:nucleotide-binding universal stress UspA family protein
MIYHHILVAYDGSQVSEKALVQAIKITESKLGTRLTVAHVSTQSPIMVAGFGFVPPAEYLESVQQYETALMKRVRANTAGLNYTNTVILTGNSATAILEYAHGNNCDLIIMGSRGLGAIQEWMLGSVSHHVVQKARIPVLIVK